MKKFFSILGGISVIVLSTISCTFAYTQEQLDAYQWAHKYGITTQPNIEAAKLNGNVTRQAFAKMVVNYLENVVGIKQTSSNFCKFSDESEITSDLRLYARKTCAYDIMGSNGSDFRPINPLTRAQLGTVLSRILRGDEYNNGGKWYYIYHLNMLKEKGIMNSTKNPDAYAKRGDVLIMLKRMYEKFGSNVHMNLGNTSSNSSNIINVGTGDNSFSFSTENDDDDYISTVYDNSNVIYTSKDGTKYYYDDKFLNILKDTADKKGESDLFNYLKIEAEYFKNGLDQLSDLDDEDILESMGIAVDDIDPDQMTKQEKQELIKKLKTALGKIIDENKSKNNQILKDLEKITKNIKNDKFGLKEKYSKTKTFMEASNEFLDLYSESILDLIELALMNEEGDDESDEGMAQAFGLIGIALAYQGTAQEYQIYVEEWAVNTIKLLGGELSTSDINYGNGKSDNQNSNQKFSTAQKRARDVERKTALSQVQSAIVTSQADKGVWPGMNKGATKGISIFDVEEELMYAGMSRIPSDPTGSKEINGLGTTNIVKGGYSYLVAKRNGTDNAGFVLMAKQETAGSSNWVVCNNKSGSENGYITNDTDLANIKICSKVEEGNSCSASKCTYTNDDELRYIVIY